MARTRAYRNGTVEAEGFPVKDVSDWLGDPGVVVWVDFCRPTAADLAEIADELGLHALAVEDALEEHQRPKLDRYESHSFLTAYCVNFHAEDGEVSKAEVDAFVTPNALVTVRKDEGFPIDEVVARWDGAADLAKSGVAYLLHGLLDYIVDGHFEAVQALDDQIERLEDDVFEESTQYGAMQRRSLRLRKSLTALRRAVLPMNEVISAAMRHDLRIVDDVMMPYFQDVHDHALRAAEWTDSLRELINTVRETQLSLQGNRMNMIMKKVTSWAAIIAIPTAVTGFYGQNVPYPGFQAASGFWTSTAVIVVLAVGLYFVFRKRDWL
ncbi:magnesium transporter CorA family protein [Labedaea rhizosphaerae]|uniref:Magnesium transporter n=1 Tax=Labedaea rhizosphaerae TaxID=598644 RepID=A0A4R6SH93_LABRH|nr:magnesium transporter CorA family protein [Labedaea rhizosphaerae]TDQ00977.1 magnesium transporter [Labedaea rhizosphaerae]